MKGKQNLVVFSSKTMEYTRLDKKITKGLIEKFLKANLHNDKRLKKSTLKDKDLEIKRHHYHQEAEEL